MTQAEAEAIARKYAADLELDVLDVDQACLVEQPIGSGPLTQRVWYIRFPRSGIENVVTSAPFRCVLVDDATGAASLFC
jgi:hypothetical protein